MVVPQKLKMELSNDPVIPLLGRYPKELKAGSQRDICTIMFTKALFARVKKTQQNPEEMKYSTEKWRNKMWHIHKMEYSSVLKEILRHTTRLQQS